MKDYSQNGEQQIILDYFKDFKGNVVDIGANDGITLSNSYALIQQGWSGVLVEPSKETYNKIFEIHQGKSIEVFNVAISDKEGEFEFFESGTHLNKGDTSLLSTLKKEELDRWKGSDNQFSKSTCKAITFKTLLEKSTYKKFDFITIDAEGLDFEILSQIDLNEVGCKLLCVETNSVCDLKYIQYCTKFGMKVHYKNYENLIFKR